MLMRLENMKLHEVKQLVGIPASTVEKHVIRATTHFGARCRP